MSGKPTHWLYPIHAGTDHWFEDKDGNPILDPDTGEYDTSVAAFWSSLRVNDAERWYLNGGFRIMKPNDLIWIYAASPAQAIVGLGRATNIYLDEFDGYWYVDIIWDQTASAALRKQPIPRSLFGDIPQSPAIRPSAKARKVLENWLEANSLQSRLTPSDDALAELDDEDARIRVLSEVVRRQGQPEFRLDLIIAYEGKCAVSGCAVSDVLEAAHIRPYYGPNTNRVNNGLLLRADLHVLFDRHLLTIDKDYLVALDPSVRRGPYRALHGKPLRLPASKNQWPSKALLRNHRKHAPKTGT